MAIEVIVSGVVSPILVEIGGLLGPVGAAGADAQQHLSAILTTPESGDTNSIALKASAVLTIPLSAGVWDIHALIVVSAGAVSPNTAGARQKLSFTGTGTWAGANCYQSSSTGSTASTYPNSLQPISVDALRQFGSSGAMLRTGVLTAATAGNLVVEFAQNVATGGGAAPILEPPSYLRAIRKN